MDIAKLRNLRLMARALIKFPFRGYARQAPKTVRRILIVQSNPNVGDITCITPMFRAVKQQYPDAKLILLCKKKPAEMVAHNPYLDEVIEDLDEAGTVDFACLTNPSVEMLAKLYLAGIGCISTFVAIGQTKVHPITYNVVRRLVVQIPFPADGYAPRQYLRLLRPIGIYSKDDHLELYYSKEATKAVEQYHGFMVAIAPGGSTKERWWATSRYAQLVEYLCVRYHAKVFLIGGGKDSEPIEAILKAVPSELAVTSLLNQSLDELKAFIARASLVIGNDSGPIVMAEALNTPSIVIVGPTDETANHPSPSALHRIALAPSRGRPVMYAFHWEHYNRTEAQRQIDAVSFEMVKTEVDALMKEVAISIPISPGELIDRITILEIKKEKITNPEQLANINYELESLQRTYDKAVPETLPELEELRQKLRATNQHGWDVENAKRLHEKNHDTGPEFIELARQAYINNDERSKLKKAINTLLKSKIVEEKSYTKY